MNLFAISGGLMKEGDLLSLSPSLSIEANSLVDLSNGARHMLIRISEGAIKSLKSPIIARSWIAEMQNSEITTDQISEIICFLNSIGAIEIRRSYISGIRFECERLKFRLFGVRLITIARRRPSNFRGLNKSIFNALAPVIALIFVTGLLEFGAGFGIDIFLYGNSIFITCLWCSTFVHEYIHILFSKDKGYRPIVLQRGLRIGILHRTLSIARGTASALSGPLVGFLVAVAIAVVTLLISSQLLLAVFAMSVAFFHLLSWLPNYGDGQAILKSIRGYYATTS